MKKLLKTPSRRHKKTLTKTPYRPSNRKRAPKGYVTGYDGKFILKRNAVFIKGHYYEPNVSALCVSGKWFTASDDVLAVDYLTNKLEFKYDLMKVIIDLNDACDQIPYKIVDINKDNESHFVAALVRCNGENDTMPVIDRETAVRIGFVEDLKRGCYIDPRFFKRASSYSSWFPIDNRTRFYSKQALKDRIAELQDRPNSIETTRTELDTLQSYLIDMEESGSYISIPYKRAIELGVYSPVKNSYLEGMPYTFGIELETCAGILPKYIVRGNGKDDYGLNIASVKDGSIRGGEYITGILIGDYGLKHLKKICFELSRRCIVDASCGLHVHLGNIVNNKKFTVFAHKLGIILQDEIFSLLPPSRQDNRFCVKLASVNTDLPIIYHDKNSFNLTTAEYYEAVFQQLASKPPGKGLNKSKTHPGGRWTTQRYKWLNLVPCNFVRLEGDSNHSRADSYTIEFRCHSGTTNFTKVANWVKICMAYVHYVEHYPKCIIDEKHTDGSKIDLSTIIKVAYPKTHKELLAYIDRRKATFKTMLAGQVTENKEYSEDIASTNNDFNMIKGSLIQTEIN